MGWNRVRPAVESVEKRLLLATFTVTNTSDVIAATGSPLTEGTLRTAILQSNASPGTNIINFNIASSGVQTIAPTAALPTITVPVSINGNSEPGYAGTPIIVLSGTGAGNGVNGLNIAAGSSTVQGLAIGGFTGEGISLSATGGNIIQNNYIGTDSAGVAAAANGLDGILVQANSGSNQILNNVISANTGNGIYLNGQAGGTGTSTTASNVITGNLIGTDVSGRLALGNKKDGIYVQNAPSTTIGGTTTALRNVISANAVGLELYNNSDNLTLQGNYIGVNAAGAAPLGNAGDGVSFRGVSNSTIGGSATGAGNVISGNSYGINCFVIGSSNLTIQGNSIGTDATGLVRIANANSGIRIAGPSNVTIGGTAAGARNIISGNTGDGISMFGNAAGLVIQANSIGVGSNGVRALGNGGAGVDISFQSGVTVGGTAAGAGNIIANNGFTDAFNHSGVIVGFDTSADPILSNSIYNNANLGIENTNTGAQAAPVLTAAVSNNNTSTINGSLTTADGTYLLQFFSTPSVNRAGNAEGQTFLGSYTATVTGGSLTFSAQIGSGFTPTTLITATATPIVGNVPGGTSVFSNAVTGTGQGPNNTPPVITGSGTPTTIAAGQNTTDTFTITNTSSVADSGIAFSATIPAGVVFVSGSSSTGAPVVVTNGVANATFGNLAAGASVTVSLVLTVGSSDAASFSIVGNVTATSPTIARGADTATITTNVSQSSDLSVNVVSNPTSVGTGQNITYQVTVANNGPSAATGVTLTDTLPAGVTYVSGSTDQNAVVTQTNGVVTANIGNLAPGGVTLITIVVATDPNTPATITDTATVVGNQSDNDPTNNTATASTIVVASADLTVVSDTAAPTSLIAGNPVTFKIVVRNNGPSPATGVILADVLGPGLMFLSGTAAGGDATISDGVVQVPVGNLASGATSTITITAMTTATGTLSDAASVSGGQSDPDPSNNAGSASVMTTSQSDLTLAFGTPAGIGNVGDTLTYTATITNNGPSPATNVFFYNPIPANANYVSSALDGTNAGTVTDGTLAISVGTLAPGASATVTVVLIPTQAGAFTETARATLTEFDPTPANNTASVTTTVVIPSPTIAFDATVTTVNENAGTATILLNRIGSMGTEVSVHFSTVAGGNATAGVDYTPVSTIVTFPVGVSQVAVTVPVLADPFDRVNEVVNLQIDTPTGGAVLAGGATATTATLQIINLDPVLVGPKVTGLKIYGPINAISAVEIDTTGSLDPATATLAGNYSFLALGGTLPRGTVVPAGTVAYNPANGSLLVFPATALPNNEVFVVLVNGSTATAVTDRAGNPLNSVYGSVAGSNYGYVIARGNNFTYSDSNGTAVTIRLAGAGAVDLNETLSGQVERLQLIGVNATTTVSGSVSPKGRFTTVGQVLGFGQFGTVKSKLYTPPFYVTTRTYPSSTSLVGAAATDVLIGTTATTATTKKTAKVRTRATIKSASGPVSTQVEAAGVVVPTITAVRHPRASIAQTAHKRPGR